MKKFRVVLIAVLLVAVLTSTAFAASISSVNYNKETGKLTVSASNVEGKTQVYLGSTYLFDLSPVYTTGTKTLSLEPGSYTVYIYAANGDASKGFKVEADAPVEPDDTPSAPAETPTAPVETPTAPVETPTAPVETPTAPVETPTAPVETPTAPVETPTAPVDTPTAPATTAPATTAPATTAPAEEDDEVPKTGDTATAAYLIGAAMVLAAAYLLLRRRVHSK